MSGPLEQIQNSAAIKGDRQMKSGTDKLLTQLKSTTQFNELIITIYLSIKHAVV